jgi:hypothetical protein
MPATARPNRTLAAPPPQEAARYRVPEPLPPELHEDVGGAMRFLHRAMQEHPPGGSGVEAAIAYTKASWKRPVSEFTLYAIGEAPDRWDLMENVVDAITPHQLGSTPLTRPLLLKEWERSAEEEGPLWRYVTRRGILLHAGR